MSELDPLLTASFLKAFDFYPIFDTTLFYSMGTCTNPDSCVTSTAFLTFGGAPGARL